MIGIIVLIVFWYSCEFFINISFLYFEYIESKKEYISNLIPFVLTIKLIKALFNKYKELK